MTTTTKYQVTGSGVTEHSPAAEKDINDGLTIGLESLLRVLKGTAVATKAPDHLAQSLTLWLQTYELGQDMTQTNDALNFSQWRGAMTASSEINKEGLRQLGQVTLAVALLRERVRRGLDVGTKSIDTIWGLVCEAIVSAEGTDLKFSVTRSAQGFLAVPLCSLVTNGRIEELWRLHAWLPDGQRGVSEEVCIHAHQPFGQSRILLGSGTDCTFDVDKTEDPALATHAAYDCCYAGADGKHSSGASGYQTHQITSTIMNTGRLLTVRPSGRELHTRDMTYSVPGGAYHRSVVSGSRLHATLFVFDSERGYDDNAAVLGPKDGNEWVQPRDPDGVTAVMLAQIVDAARRWEQTHEDEVNPEGDEEHPTVMAYYRLFRGLGLLRSGQRDAALPYLEPVEGSGPAQVFSKDASPQHQEFMKQLTAAGVA